MIDQRPSRYGLTPQVALSSSAGPAYALFETPGALDGDPDHVRVQVTASDVGALDALALAYYGDERLWWVIAAVNGIADPEALRPGDVILVPRSGVGKTAAQQAAAAGR